MTIGHHDGQASTAGTDVGGIGHVDRPLPDLVARPPVQRHAQTHVELLHLLFRLFGSFSGQISQLALIPSIERLVVPLG